MLSLNEQMLKDCYAIALSSPDPSTQNAAFIVAKNGTSGHAGCNTFTRGVEATPERLERPLKYSYVEHAERNAIFAAARAGAKLDGATMYCPWAACIECARAIVQVGITTLVRHKQASDRSPERWIESIALADELLIAGGVEIIDVDCDNLGAEQSIMHCEVEWKP